MAAKFGLGTTMLSVALTACGGVGEAVSQEPQVPEVTVCESSSASLLSPAVVKDDIRMRVNKLEISLGGEFAKSVINDCLTKAGNCCGAGSFKISDSSEDFSVEWVAQDPDSCNNSARYFLENPKNCN